MAMIVVQSGRPGRAEVEAAEDRRGGVRSQKIFFSSVLCIHTSGTPPPTGMRTLFLPGLAAAIFRASVSMGRVEFKYEDTNCRGRKGERIGG
jgi:hypothetical protein